MRFSSIIVKAGGRETSHAKSGPFATAGISGKGPAGNEASDAPVSTGGAFARMSDVIPPLPAPHSTADDDDWEAWNNWLLANPNNEDNNTGYKCFLIKKHNNTVQTHFIKPFNFQQNTVLIQVLY